MNRNKFAGILAGGLIAILILLVRFLGNIMYDDGDTIDSGVAQAFCGMGLISILMFLS